MSRGLRQTVAPSEEPITTAEAKTNAWIEISDDDTFVDSIIKAGRERCERVTGRQLVTATWELYLDDFPGATGTIIVPKPPLQSVSSITYLDTAGTSQTLATANYKVDAISEPGRIVPAPNCTWPGTRQTLNAVTVTFVAGYGLAAAVPEEIKDRIKAYVMHRYEHRGQEGIDEEFLDAIFRRSGHGYLMYGA